VADDAKTTGDGILVELARAVDVDLKTLEPTTSFVARDRRDHG
jgi:hypothetical protein